MKKKWIVAAILLLTAVLVSACAKETGNNNKLPDLDNMTDADIEKALSDFEKQEAAAQQSQQQANPEPQWETYECLPEMLTATPEEAKIQIDDVIYQECYLMTMQECMDRLAGSSAEYTYEYNPDKLVSSYVETVNVFKNGESYFAILATNNSSDTIALKDAKVKQFVVLPIANENVYYMNGMPKNGEGWTYASVKEYFSDYSDSFQESSTKANVDGQQVDGISLSFQVPLGVVGTSAGGMEENGFAHFNFTFNADNGECTSIFLTYTVL
ncbi:MAG: hypothetical protein K2K63_11030 [Acetatifactor sp.]|nr:hypothetical protein [Acetatifactor sp.]